MKLTKNIPITNLHKWEKENTFPVSIFILQKNNRAAIRELMGLDSDWEYIHGEGDIPIYHTYHQRYNDNGYRFVGNRIIKPFEGITIRWEGNPFKIKIN
jgi:hypothetical protein